MLIPAYNCAPYLEELVRRTTLRAAGDEIIIVDDASTDGTFDVAAAQPNVHVERNDASRGYGGTSKRLYEIALRRGADITVNIHGDLGHRPEDIAPLVEALAAGRTDMALGSRLMYLKGLGLRGLFNRQARHNMPMARALGHFGLTWFQNVCFGTKLHSFHDGMRGCNRKVVQWLLGQDFPSWYDFDTELLIHAWRAGFAIEEIPVPPNYNHKSASAAPPIKYGLRVARHALRKLPSRFSARGRRPAAK
ncbi:MAG: glycosyltransferase family 2 protein [Phycisphaerae bacterium]